MAELGLALPPAPPLVVHRRSALLITAAVLVVIGLSVVIIVTGSFTNDEAVTAASLPQTAPQAAPVASAASEVPLHKVAPAKPNRAANERKEEKHVKPEAETTPAPAPEPEQTSQAIKVVMQIENGRVLKASIANHKPGMDGYEAMALRIARQRRYAPTTTGGETVTISVNR